MIDPKVFFEALATHDTNFFVGVPDSLLKHFCAYVNDTVASESHIIAVNEGAAIGLASGYHLATHKTPLVYMQNSGLGNAINPLTSLADEMVYGVPMLLLIGWRGEPGTIDEPQHVKMGAVTPQVLEAIGIPYAVLPTGAEAMHEALAHAYDTIKKTNAPFALIVQKDTFTSYKSHKKDVTESYELTREAAVEVVLSALNPEDVVVSTTGKLSRELFELREKRGEGHEKDFLTVGSMGHASQIALSIALSKPNKRIFCLDGDGAALMHLGGMATLGQCAPKNLTHIVFNNGAHESVGGQETAGFVTSFCEVAKACKYTSAECTQDAAGITKLLAHSRKADGPHFIELRITSGSREDLIRPTKSPKENKSDFSAFLV
jgi:phosphonopyruvate decarboxylase